MVIVALRQAIHQLLGIGSSCRYEPCCSQYLAKAIDQRGVVRGLLLWIKRVIRCHPLGGSGWDPVPPVPLQR